MVQIDGSVASAIDDEDEDDLEPEIDDCCMPPTFETMHDLDFLQSAEI
jgi:hypothetical protein